MSSYIKADNDIVEQINAILKQNGKRLHVREAYFFGSPRDLEAYTDTGSVLILPLAAGDGPNTYRVLSILKKTGFRARWLINGQPSRGTKAVVSFGWHKAPIINARV